MASQDSANVMWNPKTTGKTSSGSSQGSTAAPVVPEVDLPSTPRGGLYDLVCVGLGPASLAIGASLQDAFEYSTMPLEERPRVAFIERKPHFGWHDGMQIPGATMQTSFLKDFATFRNPKSRFTFLNYLWSQNRLPQFTALGTFTPSRAEYQDYMAGAPKRLTSWYTMDRK